MSPDNQLEDLLEILVERFGAARTLGEVYATSHALRVLREGRNLSIADVAKVTGCSKQNLSRWLKYQVNIGQATTRPSEDDARIQEIAITDPEWAYRHLESLAEVLHCEVDPPRRGWNETAAGQET